MAKKGSSNLKSLEFDFSKGFQENAFVTVFGPRGRGKTTISRLFTQLLPGARTSQHIFMIGGAKVKKLWAAVSHPYWVRDPNVKELERLFELQERKEKICQQLNMPFPPEWEITLIIDDAGTFKEFMHSEILKQLSSNGRNSHFLIIVIIQKLTHLHPECRENSTNFIGLQTANANSINTIQKEVASGIKPSLFREIYGALTRRKGAIVLNPNESEFEELCQHTHVQLLHEDGKDAIAECELEETLRQRMKEGKPERKFTNFLKPLGSPLIMQIAKEEYKEPNLDTFLMSDPVMRLLTINSFGKQIEDNKKNKHSKPEEHAKIKKTKTKKSELDIDDDWSEEDEGDSECEENSDTSVKKEKCDFTHEAFVGELTTIQFVDRKKPKKTSFKKE